jgi:hypothetical protein
MAKWRKGTKLTSKELAISAGRQFFGSAVGENPGLRGFWMEQAANLKKSGGAFSLDDIFTFVDGNLARAPKTQAAWRALVNASKTTTSPQTVYRASAQTPTVFQPSSSAAVVAAPVAQKFYEQKWFLPTVGGVTLLLFALIAFTPKRK